MPLSHVKNGHADGTDRPTLGFQTKGKKAHVDDRRIVRFLAEPAKLHFDLLDQDHGKPYQARLILGNFTSRAHFSVSSAMSLPKSAGEPASGVA
jgi:hypothetical protein